MPASRRCKEAGFDIVYETSYPLEQQDFAPIIPAAKDAGPDAFIAFSYPGDTFGLTEQAAIADLPVRAYLCRRRHRVPGLRAGQRRGGRRRARRRRRQRRQRRHARTSQKRAQGGDRRRRPTTGRARCTYASLEVLEQAITAAGSLDKAAVIDDDQEQHVQDHHGRAGNSTNNINNKFWTVGQWQDGVFQGVASTGVDGEKAPIVKAGWN